MAANIVGTNMTIPEPRRWVRLLKAPAGPREGALRAALEETHHVLRRPEDWKGTIPLCVLWHSQQETRLL